MRYALLILAVVAIGCGDDPVAPSGPDPRYPPTFIPPDTAPYCAVFFPARGAFLIVDCPCGETPNCQRYN